MSIPIIGISSGFIFDSQYLFAGYPRLVLNEDYSRSVQAAGAIPIVLPITEDYEVAKEQVKIIDGLILSGGQDVNPQEYGEEPSMLMGENSTARDIYEKLLIKAVIEFGKPIMGICRGTQIINTYFGGTLFQDNSQNKEAFIKHDQRANPSLGTHKITVLEDSFLYKAIGEHSFYINSFHHQSIKDVAPNFRIVAFATDGIIEAIESTDENLMFAVQWHPEMLSRENQAAQKLFKYFIKQVKELNYE